MPKLARSLVALVLAIGAILATPSVAVAQTGGTMWCTAPGTGANAGQLTLSAADRYLNVDGNENFVIEKVEWWDGNSWEDATFASDSNYKKCQNIDLGDNYNNGTTFRVKIRYNGTAPSSATLSQGQKTCSEDPV